MNKKIIRIIVLVVILAVVGLLVYRFYTKEDAATSLNITEKTWIENNKNKLQNISIFSDMPVLSYDGNGIVFDFLEALEKNTGLEFNKVSYTLDSETNTDYAFLKTDSIGKKDILIYTDNYAVITKSNVKYNSIDDIKSLVVGVIGSDLDKTNKYLLNANVSYKTYKDYDLLFSEFNDAKTELNAVVVPKTQCLNDILNGNYSVAYNITEYNTYFVLRLGNENKLNSILTKYYKKWSSVNFNSSYSSTLISNYFNFSNKTEQDKTKFKSKEYVYGFIKNAPYDLSIDGVLYGINSKLISSFVNLSNVKIKFKEYKNYLDLVNAFNSNEIDFYMNNSSINKYSVDAYNTKELYDNNLLVLSELSNNISVNSLNSLENTKVLTIENSNIANTLKDYDIETKLYDSMTDLVNHSNNSVIVIDGNNYNYYKNTKLKNFKIDYQTNYKGYTYTVRDIKDNKSFEEFLNFFITFEITRKFVNEGINSLVNVDMTSLILPRIGLVLLILIVITVIVYIVNLLRPSNIKRRRNTLSKEDKLKYIDVLTSLKNRNFLNDSIEKWDESEVYPQTIVMIDLNNIAYINDNYGHAEGDKIIKDASNILIRSQLNNTEMIRTNGNEFLIYMVSYDEKQVLSYIRKLNKEFKDLEHGFGAAIGYSVINDAIKTIDDAINEATIDMRTNKEEEKK